MTAQELYDNLILPQLAAMGAEVKTPALVAINETIRQLAAQMMEAQSDLVMLTWRPSVSTTRTRAYFPDGFQGFREHPVLVGDTIACFAELQRVGHTSMSIHIEVWVQRYAQYIEQCVTEAVYTYVALDAAGRPHPVYREGNPPPLDPGP